MDRADSDSLIDLINRSVPNPALEQEGGELYCLHELFEQQVDRSPDHPALVCEDRKWTYGELDREANRLARLLRFHDAGPGQLVGLYFERSAHPIVAILACLKAGAAYVPIDPIHPRERVRHILEESEATLLVTDSALAIQAQDRFDGTVLVLDQLGEELHKQPDFRLSRREVGVSPSDLCYVLYTSGTTGRPKGVMTEHRNAVLYVDAFNELCRTGPEDQVYQGFALGFDGSVEEMWMAFSNGSTLVVGTRETPKFGDDLALYLAQRGVTYFSTVPTLLTTLSREIPSLRTLVVSGEVCPPEVVERWATDRCRLLNVYGPTEATVNTTLAECRPGQPVTIGRPLRGYTLHVLDENLNPVAPGEQGELFISGPTLARGYLKQPELTASQFVELANPALGGGRFYRTGDLVRWNEAGEMEFFGRIDGQIKIRGYRVELGEIESVLREFPGVLYSVVRLVKEGDVARLAAYVVLESGAVLDRGRLREHLRSRLPDYMVPSYVDEIAEVPRLASGKVDRKALPSPVAKLNGVASGPAPETEVEHQVALAWSKVLGVDTLSVDQNFFLDLGGHSLLAAQVVTFLRNQFGLEANLRDAYRYPTIREFARQLRPPEPSVAESRHPSSREVFEAQPSWVRAVTGTLQAVLLYPLYGMRVVPGLVAYYGVWKALQGQWSWGALAALLLGLWLGMWPLQLGLALLAKWALIGRYRPGRYPLWGSFYLRWWLVTRLQAGAFPAAFLGTPLVPWFFRLMGAQVGKRCTLDSAMVGCWDLIRIGDDTSIGADTQLLGYRVEEGMLVLGTVEIGDRCFVGLHSAFGLNSRMEDDSRLDDQSLLPDGAVIPKGEGRRGSPPVPAEVSVPALTPVTSLRRAGYGLLHLMLAYGSGLLTLPLTLFWVGIGLAVYLQWGPWALFGAMVAAVPVGVPVYCLFVAALKRLILPRVEPGTYSVYSGLYLRKWFADGLIRASRATLLPLYTTLYLPPFLRLLGARVGKRAELSTVWYFSPDSLDVGEESFFADGCILGGRRAFGGQVQLGINRVGRRSFVGNSALLPTGAGLGDHCLLGVLSAPPAGSERTPDGTEWLGVPAFELPNRPKPYCFDEEVTYRPGAKLYAQRAVIDGLRILIPGYLGLATWMGALATLWSLYGALGLGGALALAPVVSFGFSMLNVAFVVLLKWTVMGTFHPVTKPLWSMYVWLNEMVNGVYESVMAPAIAPLLGTRFVLPLLRSLGIHIGKATFVESTLFSEFDLVHVGSHAALNAGAVIQNHLFEDRVMKSSHLRVGDECSVGNMAVVLYDTEMGQGSALSPLSLLMKGERLQPRTRWHGIPTVPAPHVPGAP